MWRLSELNEKLRFNAIVCSRKEVRKPAPLPKKEVVRLRVFLYLTMQRVEEEEEEEEDWNGAGDNPVNIWSFVDIFCDQRENLQRELQIELKILGFWWNTPLDLAPPLAARRFAHSFFSGPKEWSVILLRTIGQRAYTRSFLQAQSFVLIFFFIVLS